MKKINIALLGNPNTGKTSLFNLLTGLQQKTGNYPGVTVDKKIGSFVLKDDKFVLEDDKKVQILDLPGTYSIHPNSHDEKIVLKTLLEPDIPFDAVVVVAEISNLKANLFLCSQIKDLGFPTILVVNMMDRAAKKGIQIDVNKLSEHLKMPVIPISTLKKQGIEKLKKALSNYEKLNTDHLTFFFDKIDSDYFNALQNFYKNDSIHLIWLQILENDLLKSQKQIPLEFLKYKEKIKKNQHKEIIFRHQYIREILKDCYKKDPFQSKTFTAKIDKFLLHPFLGYVFFALILFLMFQAIFTWSSLPMDFIDTRFADFSNWVAQKIPQGMLNNLITQGIITGIGGIVIFVPQIFVLFLFVEILEQSGYMSRAAFLMDRWMRFFGMNGRSVIALISGNACAIPAVMATRNIRDWKVRLITILVLPFTTCSARLPVYAILIALVIPAQNVMGFNLQGIVLMGLYLLGIFTAIFASLILNSVLKMENKSFFIMQMPDYKMPILKNIFIQVLKKSKSFVFGAGKIILAISIILWFLSTHGGSDFKNAKEKITKEIATQKISEQDLKIKIQSYKLEKSYIGTLGKFIEPAIKPLGYDWKIGIALITSFAAREVFVGTLATIYSVDNEEDTETIKEKMAKQIHPETKKPVFNVASGMGLMIFYAFAMQCMGTLAIVKRETKSWKYPLLQLFGMGILAYFAAFIVYQILK